MIIYNLRANGPYEYDKFILNFGQLYNMCADTKDAWQKSKIQEQDAILTKQIQLLVDPSDLRNSTDKNTLTRGLLSRIALAKEILTE